MVYEEVTIKTEEVYSGKILSLKVDTVELPDKKYSKREIVEHSGGVAIVAIRDGNIILVKQYRKAVERELLEIPAGKLELNEEPIETASRELQEETGFLPDELEYLTEIYPTPGYCTEKIHIYLAKGLSAGEQNLDEHEHIDVIEIPIKKALKMVKNGEIMDAKTIVGILTIVSMLDDVDD